MIQNAKEPMGFVYSMAAAQLFYFMYGHDPPPWPSMYIVGKAQKFFPKFIRTKNKE